MSALHQVITGYAQGGGVGGMVITQWTDTAVTIDQGSHIETSPLARAVFTTDATSITLNGYRDITSTYDYLAELGVIVNGTYLQAVPVAAVGTFSATVTLPAGTGKTVEIVNGPTTRISGSGAVLGTWLKSISGNAPVTQTFPTATNKTLFLVDSIGVGSSADNCTQKSYISVLRRYTTDSLIVYGWGFNQTDTIMGDSTKRAAMMTIVNAVAPAKIVDTLGTNDWALLSSSPTTLVTKKGAFYDDVHTSLPSCSIFAVKITIRNPDATTNGQAFTPDQFRDAVDTAATGRVWVTVVNGKAFFGVSGLADDVHPTTVGHHLWAEGIAPSLGYTVPALPIGSQLVNAGPDTNGTSTLVGGLYQCRKTAGGLAFNNGYYGLIRSGDFRYKIENTSLSVMMGLNPIPNISSGYADMPYCIYRDGNSLTVYDNGSAGANIGTIGADPETKTYWIDRTGTTVEFRQGTVFATAAVLRTTTISGNTALDLSMADAAGTADVTVVI
jgi:hypothetical protein